MYSFCKSERLCSKILFGELLSNGISFVKYPFRIVVKDSSRPNEYPARIAVSVSKKKFKRAIKRNRIKRLTREAFRLNKPGFYASLPQGHTCDILFIYLDNNMLPYRKVESAVQSAIKKIPGRLFSSSEP